MTRAELLWLLAGFGCLAVMLAYTSRVKRALKDPSNLRVGWRWHLAALVVLAVFVVHPLARGLLDSVWHLVLIFFIIGPCLSWLERAAQRFQERARAENED